jgi:uncharacterized membrane protein YdjX (TVP38/TMEM64 family)
MKFKRIALSVCILAGLTALYYYSPIHKYFQLANIKAQSDALKYYVDQNFLLALSVYAGVFMLFVLLSLPVSIILTLLGGYLFGVLPTVAASTVAVVLGVTISYVIYRWVVQDALRTRYRERAQRFEQAMQQYGLSYLLMLHFSGLFPYAMINILAACARVPLNKVALTTALGFIPQAFIYAFAGKKLATIERVKDIFTPQVVLAFVLLMLLALVPMLVKRFKQHVA